MVDVRVPSAAAVTCHAIRYVWLLESRVPSQSPRIGLWAGAMGAKARPTSRVPAILLSIGVPFRADQVISRCGHSLIEKVGSGCTGYAATRVEVQGILRALCNPVRMRLQCKVLWQSRSKPRLKLHVPIAGRC